MLTSIRTNRLALRLALRRDAIHYDIQEKRRLTFPQRSQALNKYKGMSDVFGSFTHLPKLGINPQSGYNTPIGVYCYPVDYILETLYSRDFGVPFQAGAPYLHIFRVSNLDKALQFSFSDNHLLGEYKSEDSLGLPFNEERYQEVKSIVDKIKEYVNQTLADIPTRNPYSMSAPEWGIQQKWYASWISKLHDYTGFKPDPDDPIDIIIYHEGNLDIYRVHYLSDGRYGTVGLPDELILSRVKAYLERETRLRVIIFPYENSIRDLPGVRSLGDGYLEKKRGVLNERVVCDQGFAWNMTRHLSGFTSIKWTGMMRRLGIVGAVDHNTGTIHSNEPTQAVFFDPASIRVLEVIHNRPPDRRTYDYRSRDLARWAEDAEKNEEEVYRSLRNNITNIIRGGDFHILKDIFKLISWLNNNIGEGTDENYWNRASRNSIATILEAELEEGNSFLIERRDTIKRLINLLRR